MNQAPFAETPAGRMIAKLLRKLAAEVGARGLELREPPGEGDSGAGAVLLQIGAELPADPATDDPAASHAEGVYVTSFSGYVLRLGRAPAQMTPAMRRLLRVYRKLTDILIRGLRRRGDTGAGYGGIGAEFLLESFLEIFRIMEDRSLLLENYQKIIQLNEKILMAEDLVTVLQVIMDTATQALRGEGSSLLLVDQKTGEMYFNVVSGENQTELREVRIPAGRGIAGGVVRSAKPEIIRDMSQDPRAFQQVDQILGQTTRDMAVAPIIARGQVIGVIEVVNSSSPHGFLSEDLELLSNIASHTSLFIENIKSKEDLIRSNRELDRKNNEIQALYEIGKQLNTTLDPLELRRVLLRTLLRLMRIDSGAVLELAPDGRSLIRERVFLNGDRGVRVIQAPAVYRDITDVMLWLREHREPFHFLQPGDDEETARADDMGLAARFRRANAELFEAGQHPPEAWLPIFAPEPEAAQDGAESGEARGPERDDGEVGGPGRDRILFVLSLGGTQLRRRSPVNDLAFFRGVMNQAYAAFRNVESYREAVHAKDQEHEIRQAFQKYVPLRVVQDVLEEDRSGGGVQQEVAVLFADIRNFTHLAELTAPADLVALLNEYFEEMVDVIDRHEGVVDKFMGDGMMGLFGAPDARAGDAARALSAAEAMLARLDRLNERRASEGRPQFAVGIGLHCGPAIVGNIGSRRRMDFTAIGDTINLASRLEKLGKIYRTDLIFTEELRDAATKHGFVLRGGGQAREVDQVLVRGRSQPVRIFHPFDGAGYKWPGPELEARWQEALDLYRNRDFSRARELFQGFAAAAPEGVDPLADVYAERCRQYGAAPPSQAWDGIFTVDV